MLKIRSFTAGAAKVCIDNKSVMANTLHRKPKIAFAGSVRGHFRELFLGEPGSLVSGTGMEFDDA